MIAQARALQPERIKGKEAREALTVEQKEARKKQQKEIRGLLKPIVQAHKTEVEKVKASLPENAESSNPKKKKDKNAFACWFLLMEV